ncbi:YcjF family protein [Pseudomonas typographi]|uniref:YcjF family protein n=1 Tax=Pseudomonas typographi TaxID=2715964 RepID=UPI0016860FAA|nr:GTPase [Pseudomonas typographi]MBD1550090.1 kinase [Pseudomonas typographi]
MKILDRVYRTLNPEENPALLTAFARSEQQLPTLWLLGKTGAGKSSMIRALTGLDRVEVGSGFRPCTLTSAQYAYPTDTPVLAFMDTRGLAEADYDAAADIATCEHASHALIVVMKAEDPEQSQVLKALRQIKRSGRIREALLVHSGIYQVPDEAQRQRCIRHNQQQVEDIWGLMESITVDFNGPDGQAVNLQALKDKLGQRLPIITELFQDQGHSDAEEHNFQQLKSQVMWYAGAAGACDALPAVGLVAVPSVQLKMLHSLANQYGLDYSRRLLTEFAAAMGTGFGVQYASRLGLRQLAKLVPVWGQTVGSAGAAVASYCFTYALGRAACMYFYRLKRGEPITSQELRGHFKQALEHILPVARDEKSH